MRHEDAHRLGHCKCQQEEDRNLKPPVCSHQNFSGRKRA
jgi:hypothetical protein